MEEHLFSFDGAQGDASLLEYFNIQLKQPIGEFPAGHSFHRAEINTDKATLSFYAADVLLGRYQIQINIVKDLLNE